MSRTVRELGDVCTIVNGGTPNTKDSTFWNGSHAWITPAEMGKSSREVTSTARTVTDAGLKHTSNPLPPNSVILSTRAPIGHLVINQVPMSFNQGCRGLVPNGELNFLYLYYFLLHSKDLLQSLGNGTTFAELSTASLKSVKIPLTSLDEQKKTVDWLESSFKEVDALESNFDIERSKLVEFVMTISAEVLGGPKGSSEGREKWPTKPLGELCEILDSKRKPVTKSDRIQGEIPYYGATGVLDYVEDFIFDEKLVLLGEDGAKWGAGDNSAFIVEGKTWVNNHAHVLRPNREVILDEWLTTFLVSADLTGYVSGVTVPKLNQGRMREIPIPLPPLELQRQILSRLDIARVDMNKLLENSAKKKNLTSELRKTLLVQVFGEAQA
jgi:type I restriction enzyme S subunit